MTTATPAVPDSDSRDDDALDLRSSGASFARIARSLGYGRARDANEAFHRAMQRRPLGERQTIRTAEFARLDDLERVVRDDGRLTAEELAKRLHTIDRLRDRLLAN